MKEVLHGQERSLLYWGGRVLPLGQTKPQLGRYFCISHMNKVMGETRTLTHHARAAALNRMVPLAESYEHNALAMAHLEQNVRSWSSNRETREMEIFKQGQGTQRRETLCLGHTSSTLWPFLAGKIHTAVTLQINVPSDECICSDAKPSRASCAGTQPVSSRWMIHIHRAYSVLMLLAELLRRVLTYSGLHQPPAVLPEAQSMDAPVSSDQVCLL